METQKIQLENEKMENSINLILSSLVSFCLLLYIICVKLEVEVWTLKYPLWRNVKKGSTDEDSYSTNLAFMQQYQEQQTPKFLTRQAVLSM